MTRRADIAARVPQACCIAGGGGGMGDALKCLACGRDKYPEVFTCPHGQRLTDLQLDQAADATRENPCIIVHALAWQRTLRKWMGIT
jgi:hypothetical protein